MAIASEEISKYNSNSGGKTDSNLANDSMNLGGIPAEDYATQKYVQDYHKTKEEVQKQYIDEQDKSVLDEAKSYTDNVVGSQDFSSFAKLTDVQAVDKKLSNEIETVNITQKEYTDNKTQAIVDDVNTNFEDVNNAISTLNSNQKELFQSVSNGKNIVAAAITDKGVTTASDASFDTMATNIRNIETGGELDPNFVNTSDATASASDILVGKTAYSQGNKVYGTLIVQTETGVPTYGTDTSNATAYSSDILYGKTAYARGQLLTGTLRNAEVEEIYGLGEITELKSQSTVQTDPETGDVISKIITSSLSKNLDYCVRAVNLNSDSKVTYVESYPVNENGLYVMASSNGSGQTTYKKHRYTYEELGIGEGETISDIELSASGLDGDANKCILYITTRIDRSVSSDGYSHIYLYAYTYHLSENGVIGKMYENETLTINAIKNELYNTSYNLTQYYKIKTFNNRWNEGCAIRYWNSSSSNAGITLYRFTITNGEIVVSSSDFSYSPDKYSNMSNATISNDDRFLIIPCYSDSSSTYGGARYIVEFDDYVTKYWGYVYSGWQYPALANINGTNSFIYNTADGIFISDFSNVVDEATGECTFNISNVVNLDLSELPQSFVLTSDNKYLLVLTQSYILRIYDFEEILQKVNTNSVVSEKQNITIAKTSGYIMIRGNTDMSQIFFSLDYKLFINSDSSNIVGIRYKDKYFYNNSYGQLTAGQGDVRSGKTFIGWMGYPEIGTMEVSE